MVFGLIAAASASLLYFVGTDIESTTSANESIINQKISRISESLRIIRTYTINENDLISWGIELVNTGLDTIHITGIHYLTNSQIISKTDCSTMTKIGNADSDPCTIKTNVLTDVRFTPQTDHLAGIIIITDAGNMFRLLENE